MRGILLRTRNLLAGRSGNLGGMEKRQLTDEARAAVARGWRKSGLGQRPYAAQHAISERTLRSWVSRWAPEYRGTEAVRDVCERTVERLRALIAALNVEDSADDGAAMHSGKATIMVSPPAQLATTPVPATGKATRRVETASPGHMDLANLGLR
jgi:hypothetical protein